MVINGASDISQRYGTTSTSISGTGVQYPADRFIVQTNIGSGHSHQQVADAPTGFYYSQKITCGTGGSATGSNFGRYRTTLEWQNVIPQSGFGTSGAKQLVLSFYVKSSLTGTFGVSIQSYANNRAITNTYTINSANTWERKTIVITADTNSAWVNTTAIHMELGWDLGEGPDRGNDTLNTWGGGLSGYGYDSGTKFFTQSSATWQITGIQLEIDHTGSGVATNFEHRSYGQELALCKRYCQKFDGLKIQARMNGGTNSDGYWQFPTMRATPSWSADVSAGKGMEYGSVSIGVANVYGGGQSPECAYSRFNLSGSGTSGHASYNNLSTGSYYLLEAEL
tara:strand:- start:83 stop:1096 length:1014 start_codon:yes stop_codon:yes gene_type:complete